MRKLAIASVMVLALALGGAALASGSSPDDPADSGSATTIKVFSKTVQFSNLIDLGAKGFSQGDQFVFADDLFTERDGKSAGTDGGSCTVVRVGDDKDGSGTLQCLVTFALDDGDVTSQGLLSVDKNGFSGTQVAAITGGTRRFKHASGEVSVEFLSDVEANITFTITE